MSEVILINPPSPFLIDAKCEPPLGILYLAGAVKDIADVKVFDFGREKLTEDNFTRFIIDDLKTCRIIGITAVTPQIKQVEYISHWLKKLKSDAVIVLGGPHVTALDGDIWKEGNNRNIDIAVLGEGEAVFRELTEAVLGGGNIKNIGGIAHLSDSGEMVFTKKRELLRIDDINFPARELIDLRSYSRHIAGLHATTLITSRGCPFECSYCMKGTWKTKIRRRSTENVINELKEIKNRYRFDAVLFVDDNFTLDRKWVLDFCKNMKELEMKWRCWTRVNIVDYDMLKIMKDAGCAELSFGIESGNQKLLDIANKKSTVEQNIQAIKWAKSAGILTKAFLMIGIPGETRGSVEDTKKMIKEAMPDQWILSTFTPIVGSPIWNDPKKYGIINFNRYDFEHQWEVGIKGEGGLFIDTKWLPGNELRSLHSELFEFLKGLN